MSEEPEEEPTGWRREPSPDELGAASPFTELELALVAKYCPGPPINEVDAEWRERNGPRWFAAAERLGLI